MQPRSPWAAIVEDDDPEGGSSGFEIPQMARDHCPGASRLLYSLAGSPSSPYGAIRLTGARLAVDAREPDFPATLRRAREDLIAPAVLEPSYVKTEPWPTCGPAGREFLRLPRVAAGQRVPGYLYREPETGRARRMDAVPVARGADRATPAADLTRPAGRVGAARVLAAGAVARPAHCRDVLPVRIRSTDGAATATALGAGHRRTCWNANGARTLTRCPRSPLRRHTRTHGGPKRPEIRGYGRGLAFAPEVSLEAPGRLRFEPARTVLGAQRPRPPPGTVGTAAGASWPRPSRNRLRFPSPDRSLLVPLQADDLGTAQRRTQSCQTTDQRSPPSPSSSCSQSSVQRRPAGSPSQGTSSCPSTTASRLRDGLSGARARMESRTATCGLAPSMATSIWTFVAVGQVTWIH